MKVLNFIKEWTLPCAMVLGAGVYLLFSEISLLQPVGNAVGPVIMELMPVLIFAILYVTFCKIRLHDLRIRPWHIWLQVIRTGLILALVAVITATDHETKLILEGMFVCIICPTAAAAAVITDKLGGSIASMTVYTLIDNAVTSLLIPLLFPLVEAAGIDVYYFALIMIINLCLGLLTPPVGTVLYIGCSVSKLKMGQVVRGIGPFLIAEFLFLILCLLFPPIIMAPAAWFGY